MKEPSYRYPGELRVEAPNGAGYIVRVAGSGVERVNLWPGYFALLTRLAWYVRKPKRWTVQVFALGTLGVQRPPLLDEICDSKTSAVARSEQVAREISAGRLGWDRWHRRTGDGHPGAE